MSGLLGHYTVRFTGTNGNLTAYLLYDGETIATVSGVKAVKKITKWARAEAAKHRLSIFPQLGSSLTKTITGHQDFIL